MRTISVLEESDYKNELISWLSNKKLSADSYLMVTGEIKNGDEIEPGMISLDDLDMTKSFTITISSP